MPRLIIKLFLLNMHISPYEQGIDLNDPLRLEAADA